MEQISKRLMSWASILEDKTREQAVTTSLMPFIYPHVALMPDAHLGKGATVGSVIPTLGAIIPAAVGVDIGCGMMAVRTAHRVEDLPVDRRALGTFKGSTQHQPVGPTVDVRPGTRLGSSIRVSCGAGC